MHLFTVRTVARTFGLMLILVAQLFVSSAVHAQTEANPVKLRWYSPAANATVSGTVRLYLVGQAFQNVEIFHNGQFFARATVNARRTGALVSIDTKRLPNGPITFTAHAWNSPAGTAFTSEADAGSRTFNINNATAPAPTAVSVRWTSPAPNASVAGRVRFQLTGANLKRVELSRNGQLLARASVSADFKSATADVDTSQFANGPLTVTAHAWNSAVGQPSTSEASAGPLTVTVNNPIASNPDRELGVYVGNDVAAVRQFESWLGAPVEGILGYTGDANWADYDGSVGWAIGLWSAIDRPVFWSIPLIPKGATLEAAARGDYNNHYLRAAQQLAKYRPQDAVVHIRTGWEFNGDWFPWTIHGGKEQAFIDAYQQFVKTFRSVSNRFVFEWNVNIGETGTNPEAAYPGDAYVDVIGIDFYWNRDWGDPADPIDAWNYMVDRKYGLKWHQQFAAAHGKRMSYSEWGVKYSNAGPYIERAKAWFEANDIVFHTYWDSNSSYPGKLSQGQYGQAGETYRRIFR